ncbi:MAG: phosphomethylpyrimidine synthase [Methanosarcinales archaeon]
MTLMENAKKGIITSEMEIVAKNEGLESKFLKELIAKGYVTIPKNICRDNTNPIGIGEYLKTKINANVGTSNKKVDIKEEIEKAKIAIKYGADTVMDLSTCGNLDKIRRSILNLNIPVGTVPIYQAAMEYGILDMTSDDLFNIVRKHAEDGVDFITIHAGVNKNTLERLKKTDRILEMVSRGGSFTLAWMMHNGEDNPFYSEYDYLLEIAKEYDLTLSLGDGMRPGCLADASDRPKFMEFIILGELVKSAREYGVQTLVEGPGHVPLDEIEVSVKAMKHLTNNAPLYLLGPLVTDIAPGYDHITSAIGGSVAGMCGADFLCMVTPSEHLGLPTLEDIKEGVIVTKIAAHVADTVKNGVRDRARTIDKEIATARKNLDWNKQFSLAIDEEKAKKMYAERNKEFSETCSMCGDLCTIKIMKELFRC